MLQQDDQVFIVQVGPNTFHFYGKQATILFQIIIVPIVSLEPKK